MDQNQPISPCNGDAISASVRIIARSLQHRRVAWMHDFRDSPTRRSSHSTNPEVERRRSRRDTAPPNFRVFKVNQPVCLIDQWVFTTNSRLFVVVFRDWLPHLQRIPTSRHLHGSLYKGVLKSQGNVLEKLFRGYVMKVRPS